MAVTFSTPQLVSASSNTATGNVTLAGGKRIFALGTARGAGSETFPAVLTVGGVTPTLVNVGGTDARIAVQTSSRQFFLAQIPAVSNPGAGTQSCTITWTAGDRATLWITELTGDDGSFVDLDVGETNAAGDTRNVTSTATGQALFAACIRASTATFSWTTSTSDEIAEGGAAGAPMAIGRMTLGAAGNYTSVWAVTSGTSFTGQIAVVIADAGSGAITGALDEVAEQATESLTGGVVLTAALAESAAPVTESLTGGALIGGQLGETAAQATETIEGEVLLGASLAEVAAQSTEAIAGALPLAGSLTEQAEPATETITNEQNLTGQLEETASAATEALSGGLVITASLAEVATAATEALEALALLGGALAEQATQATEGIDGALLLSGVLDEETGAPIETISSGDEVPAAPPVAAGPWVDTITTAPMAAGAWVDTQSPPVAAGPWADTV